MYIGASTEVFGEFLRRFFETEDANESLSSNEGSVPQSPFTFSKKPIVKEVIVDNEDISASTSTQEQQTFLANLRVA